MDVEYKRVLERRKTQLVRIRWTREMSSAFARHALLSVQQLRDIELDQSERDGRMLTALAMLTKQDDARAFETFRTILVECGHDSMAESLDFDRSRICWAFEKPPRCQSLCDYIDRLSADLLQASLSEPDEHIRGRMIAEALRRLAQLRCTLREQQLDRDHFRKNMWRLVTGKPEPSYANHQPPQSNFGDVSEIQDAECERDEQLQRTTHRMVDAMRRRINALQRQNEKQRDALAEHGIEWDSAEQLASTELQEIAADSSEEINHPECIWRFHQTQFADLMASLQPFLATTTPSATSDFKPITFDELTGLMTSAGEEFELLRKRCHLLNNHVERLKKEREEIAQELGISIEASDHLSLLNCIRDKLDELRTITNSLSQQNTESEDTNFDLDSGFECFCGFQKVIRWQKNNELLNNPNENKHKRLRMNENSSKPYAAARSELCSHVVSTSPAHAASNAPRRHSLPLENKTALMKSNKSKGTIRKQQN